MEKKTFWIMKYKKGSTVEVFCNPSWRCARIVSGKGHNYTVSYDVYPGFTSKDDLEHISVKSIRPCPPLLETSESWAPGDVVEVFHNLSWKMATVLKDFGLDQFIVGLVGSLQEFEVTKSELRVRQSYQNGQWIVTGKVPSDHKEDDQDLHERVGDGNSCTKGPCIGTQNNHHLMESRIVSSKSQKRASPYCNSQDETNKKRARKLTMSKKEGKAYRNRTSGYESSSGSCSINSYKPFETYHGSGFCVDIEDHESDAESVCQCGYHEESQSQETDESAANEAVADEIHRLEMRAYRYTMAALHSIGTLKLGKRNNGNKPSYITSYIK